MILRLISDPEIDQRSCSFGKWNDGSGATPKWGIHMSQLTSESADELDGRDTRVFIQKSH
jgi:hypothetical protein